MSLTRDELLALPVLVPIKLAAQALDIEYQRAMRLAREGGFPLPLQAVGARNHVKKTDLLRFLGITED